MLAMTDDYLLARPDCAEADRQLGEILHRIKYVGPQPEPTEDEIMDAAAREVRAVRAGQARDSSGEP
jgi:hypothetical protein